MGELGTNADDVDANADDFVANADDVDASADDVVANADDVGVGCAEHVDVAAAIGGVGVTSGRGHDDRDADRATEARAGRADRKRGGGSAGATVGTRHGWVAGGPGAGASCRTRTRRSRREHDGRDVDRAAEARAQRWTRGTGRTRTSACGPAGHVGREADGAAETRARRAEGARRGPARA
jgi:hypothetical protein